MVNNSDTFSVETSQKDRYLNPEAEAQPSLLVEPEAQHINNFGSLTRAAEEGLKNFTSYVGNQGDIYGQAASGLLGSFPTFDDMKNAMNNHIKVSEDRDEISTLGTPPQLRYESEQQLLRQKKLLVEMSDISTLGTPPPLRGQILRVEEAKDVETPSKKSSLKNVTANASSRGRQPARGRSASRGRSKSRARSVSRGRDSSRPRGRSMNRQRAASRGRSKSTGRSQARGRSQSRPRTSQKVRSPSKTKQSNSRRGKTPQRNNKSVSKTRRSNAKKPCRKPQKQKKGVKDDRSDASSSKIKIMWKRVKPINKFSLKKDTSANGKKKQSDKVNKQNPKAHRHSQPKSVKSNQSRSRKSSPLKKRSNAKRQEQDTARSSEGRQPYVEHRRSPVSQRIEYFEAVEEERDPPSYAEQHQQQQQFLLKHQESLNGSLFGSLTNSFTNPWGKQKSKAPSMAQYENDRLGEHKPVSRKIRLEDSYEHAEVRHFRPVNDDELDSLTNSVSFQLTEKSSQSKTTAESSFLSWNTRMKRRYLNRKGKMNSKWDELEESASIIAKYMTDTQTRSSRGRKIAIDSVDEEDFQRAVSKFRHHARALGMGEKTLFATVRDDPSILEASTYDDDTLDDVWMNFGRALDDRIDEMVDGFDNVLQGVETFNDMYSCAPISVAEVKQKRRRRKVAE